MDDALHILYSDFIDISDIYLDNCDADMLMRNVAKFMIKSQAYGLKCKNTKPLLIKLIKNKIHIPIVFEQYDDTNVYIIKKRRESNKKTVSIPILEIENNPSTK